MPSTSTSNEFTLLPDGTFLREADQKEVALLDRETGAIVCGHVTYRNYLSRLEALRDSAKADPSITSTRELTEGAGEEGDGAPVSVPPEIIAVPKKQPESDTKLGEATSLHLIWDAKKMDDEAFAAKWGDQYRSGALRHWFSAQPRRFTGRAENILARLEKLS